MKIALVHDYIKEYGGAERVLEVLHEMYPTAPIYTSLYLPEFLGPHKDRFTSWNIKQSWFKYIPFKEKLISPLRLLAPFVFKSFDFSQFDVVIVSATGAYMPNMIHKKSARQICYCHTPPRYLYGYATARDWKNNLLFLILGEIVNHFLRILDYISAMNVDVFIANSEEVRSRIHKFYRKDAVVVYPPVYIEYELSPSAKEGKRHYYLAGGRLARSKGIEIILDAFINNGKPLKIFGKGFAGFEQELKRKKYSKNIEFLGEITDKEKINLMRDAKAFIFAAYDEDFGITPVESMASGTPVIAFKSGGVRETVVDRKTGLFYHDNTIAALNDTIVEFEKLSFDPEICIKYAKKYSKENFINKITKIIQSE